MSTTLTIIPVAITSYYSYVMLVDNQTPIHRVAIQEGRQWLDYTPKVVYGLNRDHFHGHDLDVQDELPLLDNVLETLKDHGIDTSKLNIIEEKD